jgi:hypothetical protein
MTEEQLAFYALQMLLHNSGHSKSAHQIYGLCFLYEYEIDIIVVVIIICTMM